ncbi:unnamed protein product (macronuclear) [Paramecium tetraurelia]|uniref:Uncharacterized protein n=1 Tax=Paramecium tetraurelia TaxID=5888 RepID=A0CU85_PARTE|nr:uncharacterized protein GSPATT00010551001 [Paramecium tetraurelia]CAK74352.1 unnamed protein product [Paramecium tetraurelia]|eukprot:XP_001441749.1 hypothetical protein (macronuclear) [Paramecium tetraurelia strain d4-2]
MAQLKRDVKKFENSKSFDKILPKKFELSDPQFSQSDDVKTLSQSISDPIYDLIDRGGKRWRPAFCFLIADLFKRAHEELYEVAALVELIHNATLVVDDIEDDSSVRRNDKCVHIKYGLDVAVNAANYLYFAPLHYFLNSANYSNDQKMKMLEVSLSNMKIVHFGQAWDIFWHKQVCDIIPTEEQYLKMASYKTGALARMAAQLSCIVLEKDEKIGKALAEFAVQIGIAFQIQDDILNLNGGDKYKQTKGYLGEDIHEGKFSLIVIHSLKQQKGRLLEILKSRTQDQETINEAISIIKQTGSLEYAHKRSLEIIEDAWKEIENLEFQCPEAKSRLKDFAKYLIERDS